MKTPTSTGLVSTMAKNRIGLLVLCLLFAPLMSRGQSSIEDFAKQRQAEEQTKEKEQKKGGVADKKSTVNIYSVLFATGSATLTEKDKSSLTNDVIPYILRFPPSAEITIEGHTDDTGGSKANLALSQRRADSVMTFLVAQGIDMARLTAKGYGEYSPLIRKNTPEARAKNRRVSLIIEDPGSSTIVLTSGEKIVARDVFEETDGTISYRKSDTDPRVKLRRSDISHITYANKTSYNPNTGIMGTIQLKNGQQIPARMIAREPGFISYKKKDTDPIMIRLREEEVQSVRYADGTVYNPSAPPGPGSNTASSTKEGLVVMRDLKKIKVSEVQETTGGVTYKAVNSTTRVETPKRELHYVVFSNGRRKYYNLPYIKFNLWEKLPHLTRFSTFGNVGVVPLTVKEAVIDFAYVDESPSRDNMRSIIQLKQRLIGYGAQLGGEAEIDSSLILRAYYQFAFNSEGATNALGLGIGKVIGKKRNMRIGADLQLGNAYVRLGNLYQNSVYIQVNDTRFYSDAVSLRFRNYFAAINPYFSIERSFKNRLFFRLNAGFAAGLHTSSSITFRGEDGDDKSAKATEKLKEANVNFKVNGERVTEGRLFGILGPQINIAAYYTLLNR